MNTGQQILFSVSALGALNGIVLSAYIFLQKKLRRLPAMLLAAMLLAISIRVANTAFVYFNQGLPKVYVQIGMSACFLIGPLVYYFFRSVLLKPGAAIPKSWKWAWAVLLGTVVVGGLLAPYEAHPYFWDRVIVYVIYCQWSLYLIAAAFVLKPVLTRFFTARASLKTAEKFWLLIFAGNTIILLSYVLSLSMLFRGMCVSGAVSFSLILYLTVFFCLYGLNKENLLQLPIADNSVKPEKRRIADADAQAWVAKLEKTLAENSIYKDPNLKVSDLAQKVNITGHQLSQLLNENLGKTFSTYINEYRINEACELILRDSRLSFEAIGYEVGYNSKSTFYTAFRKIKNTTPALFKESLENVAAK
jgi:AraC-like DNA-binding protein